MSIRKLLFATSIVFMSTIASSALAGGIEAPPRCPFFGGYVGIGLGPGVLLMKESDTAIESATAFEAATTNVGQVGFVGDLHLGYGYVFSSDFYLGGQIFGQWWTSIIRENNLDVAAAGSTTNSDKERIKSTYGISIRPGWQLTPSSLIYVDLGVAFASLTDTILSVTRTGTTVTSATFTELRRSSKAGFKVGMGTSIAPSRHFAIGLEYFYTVYGRLTLSPVVGFGAALPILPTTTSVRFSTHAVLITLDYLFKNGF